VNSLKHLVSAILFASLLLGCGGGDSNSGLDKSRTEIADDNEKLIVAEPNIETVDDDEESVVDELNLVEQTASSFKVTTPNGGQKWTTGKPYAIKWSKGKAGATVKIQLLKSGKHYKWISKKTKNDGRHTWKIPAIVTSSAYKIKITSVKNKKIFDVSDKRFTITLSKKLRVIWPKGGECLEVGRYYTIRWNRSGISKCSVCTVDIERYNGSWITIRAKNVGKYKWYIPWYECQLSGSCGTYYIEIYNSYDKKYPKEYARTKRKVTIAQKCK
jgi:hypothetical protein